MAKTTNKYDITEVQNIWKVISKGNKTNENLEFELEIHKKLLNVFQVGDYYYMIVNAPETTFDFVSTHTETVLGIKPEEFSIENLFGRVHPEDQSYVLNFESAIGKFFIDLPVEKLLKYKARYDYRVKKDDGNYIRILQQVVVIEYDDNGAVLRTLCVHTDISHLKETGNPILSIIGLEGEPSYINIDVEQKYVASSFLSRREKQVINFLLKGKLSKQIAHELSLSIHTIDTYRRNMLKKTKTNTTAELIAKAIREGWV